MFDSSAYSSVTVGARLETLRERLDLGSQRELAERLGATKNQFNNWANGVALIPVRNAIRLKAICGVTLDFIYLGDESSLPAHVSRALRDSHG